EPAKLLVEAADPATAQALFGALRQHAGGATSTLIQLSPGLFFARAHPSGRYWTFELSPMAHCE
ncbi:MAG TPA: hypothetical protein VNT26_05900, partial [Candidatus Sulfotelmatobacter sp.]|nr:hypothetical protein [Candidatus Sulfotelmatobacter sp.]